MKSYKRKYKKLLEEIKIIISRENTSPTEDFEEIRKIMEKYDDSKKLKKFN